MRANLSKRLIFWVGAPTALLFAAVFGIASKRSFDRVREQTERLTGGLVRYHAASLDRDLSSAAKMARGLATVLETGVFTSEEQIEIFLRNVVARSPEIYGSCLAFEPGSFIPGKTFYAPYFYHKDGKAEFVQLGNPEYNYFRWEWYARPREEGRPLWTEPYFDEGGGNAMMTTYSAPFHRDGKFWGIATIDIAMNQLVEELDHFKVGQSGYAFLISKGGRLLAYPEKEKVMHASLKDVNPELAALMTAGKEGFTLTHEPVARRDAWVAYVPIQGGQFSLAIVYPQAEMMAQAMEIQTELWLLGGIGLVALFAALVLVARLISRPIVQLAEAAQEVAAGNLDQRLEIHGRTEEVRNLTNAFRKMTRDLQMRMQELRYTTTVQQRLEGELSAARSIQMSLLPKRFPAFPERQEIDLYAIVKPARAVGGDFYDFYFIDKDCLCLLVADVAGKGVPAALYMAVTKTLLKANASGGGSPAQLLERVNRELYEESSTGMFASMVFVLMNVQSGEVRICNAGHPPPLLLKADGAVAQIDGRPGVALGAWRDLSYVAHTQHLELGDTLFLYTDGVTEALNPAEEFYALPRLQRVLETQGGRTAEQITRAVAQDVRAFGAEHEQADDFTVLAIRWIGPASSIQ